MDQVFTLDDSPKSLNFESDFNTYHPGVTSFKVTSKNVNLQAPLLKPFVKEVEGATNIRDFNVKMGKLYDVIQSTSAYKQIFAEITPNKNSVCEVNIVPTKREVDGSLNTRLSKDKPNTLNVHYEAVNSLNYFQRMVLGYRNRFDSNSRSVYFKVNHYITLTQNVSVGANWKDKKVTDEIKSSSTTSRLTYNKNRPDQSESFQCRVQNRSNESQSLLSSSDIQASNLFELSYRLMSRPSSNFSTFFQPKVGFVPSKSSYFAKLSLGVQTIFASNQFWLETMSKAQFMAGKNLIVNDLFEYRPKNRATISLHNKVRLYLPQYPHMPFMPVCLTVPYTYISHWYSYNPTRGQRSLNEAELGIGVNLIGSPDNVLSGFKLLLEFPFLKFREKKAVWSPRLSVVFGDYY